MGSEDGQTAYQLFRESLDVEPGERAAFLDRRCGRDAALRQEVESLLAVEAEVGGFLEPIRPAPTKTRTVAGPAPQRISHYRIERRLGAGGMGVVYQAYDIALGRPVAIKLLPEGFSPSMAARLVREAEADARLQHPGIATFYEAGESEGVTFIAMEYVVGQTLRQRLQGGVLPWEQALGLTGCLLEALGHAHAAGLLHRDIKPENIMLTEDGAVKLLDFGIAKNIGPSREVDKTTRERVTAVSSVVGTVGYMSPEQVRGEPLDARSDLFSVGAVLYEAIAGRSAFPGSTPTERIAAILYGNLEPVTGRAIPAEINALLLRALARDPAERYPSASAFMKDVRCVGSEKLPAPLNDSVAVLNFENISGSPADDWMGMAIAESLAAALARSPGLEILPRERILRTKMTRQPAGVPIDSQWLGLALGCRWLVLGTFRKVGAALQVTVSLSEVLMNQAVLTEEVDGSAETLLEMQDRLADIVGRRLSRGGDPSPPHRATSAPQLTAYECYVKAQQAWLRAEKASLQQARELLEQAVDLDPTYSPALSGLATAHALAYNFTTDSALLDTAADYARRAILADPENPDPHVWLGYVLGTRGDVLGAYKENRRSLELVPNDAHALYFAAGTLMMSCTRQEAEELCERTTGRKDTSNPHRQRRMEALRLQQRALRVAPQFGAARLVTGLLHMQLGNFRESCWCLERALEVEKTPQCVSVSAEGYLGECLRRAGELEEARRRCLAGVAAVERSDHTFRDTFRAMFLCSLGRTAWQQEDSVAARAAYHQAVLHLRGRNRTRGGGHLLVQALCGLSRTDQDGAPFEEALTLFRQRHSHNFDFMLDCSDDATLSALAQTAQSLGESDVARQLFRDAVALGCLEACVVEIE